jgi:hypothetical protein
MLLTFGADMLYINMYHTNPIPCIKLTVRLTTEQAIHLYYGLFYPVLAYGIIVWGQYEGTNWINIYLQKMYVRYMAGLKQLESCSNRFKERKILTVYSLYFQEKMLYAKEKCNCAVNKQVHTCNTRNNDYYRYVHNIELYNSKPVAPFLMNCLAT